MQGFKRDIVGYFFEFVESPSSVSMNAETLTDWLEAWTEFGNAVEVTAGDYALLLEVYIGARARTASGKSFGHLAEKLREQEHWVEGMGAILPNRDLWNAQVFRRKYPAPAPTGFIGD